MTGCAAVGDIVGAVSGLASGAATGNPAVGISVGIAARAAANELADRVALARRRNEQDAISAAVATLNTGESAAWAVDQRVSGDTHGEVRVLRVIQSSIATCKELLFSVVKDDEAQWFTTTACQNDTQWKWATAEPAVSRWMTLQ